MKEGIDTNVLVHLATRDDPEQLAKTRKLLETRFLPANPAWVNLIVVVEYVWVLARLYNYSRQEVALSLHALTKTNTFRVEDGEHVNEATALYQRGNADFANCLIAVRNSSPQISKTHTFDRKAARLENFDLI